MFAWFHLCCAHHLSNSTTCSLVCELYLCNDVRVISERSHAPSGSVSFSHKLNPLIFHPSHIPTYTHLQETRSATSKSGSGIHRSPTQSTSKQVSPCPEPQPYICLSLAPWRHEICFSLLMPRRIKSFDIQINKEELLCVLPCPPADDAGGIWCLRGCCLERLGAWSWTEPCFSLDGR